MDTLRIETGAKRLLINDGPGFIEFNPADIGFAERFYQLIRDFEGKQAEYEARALELDNQQEKDAEGIPLNVDARFAFLRECCEYVRERIDHVFGAGTSQTVFGDTLNLDMFGQFFVGITPYIQQARQEKTAKYAPAKKGRVMR
jgi:hypothetical protein